MINLDKAWAISQDGQSRLTKSNIKIKIVIIIVLKPDLMIDFG
jgi:hypothetical protein